MVGKEVTVNKENTVFSIKISLKYEKNLQEALDYSFQQWGSVARVNFHLEIIKEIDKTDIFSLCQYTKPIFR